MCAVPCECLVSTAVRESDGFTGTGVKASASCPVGAGQQTWLPYRKIKCP